MYLCPATLNPVDLASDIGVQDPTIAALHIEAILDGSLIPHRLVARVQVQRLYIRCMSLHTAIVTVRPCRQM